MKTTVEISEPLLNEARRTAVREKTTLRALLEEGLRKVLEDRRPRRGFRLRKATFRGRGLQAGVTDAGWETVREMAYKGRGA